MLEVLRYIALNALNTVQKIKAMSKISKIDQIHLRAVMLCMLKMSKMGKEHTHTYWLITSLILNGFSIQKKFWKAETKNTRSEHYIARVKGSIPVLFQIDIFAMHLILPTRSKMVT